jgi:hypothetical protein
MPHPSANRKSLSYKILFAASAALCLLMPLAVRVRAQNSADSNSVPGWYLAGTKPANYLTGVDRDAAFQGRPSAYLKAKPSATEGFGTLMQNFSAEQYLGKRVRVTAWVKSEGINDWAGVWMRVDKGSSAVSFDNMMNRPIKGTSDWQNYAVVLDVPKGATGIFFGVLLNKGGAVWVNGVQFEIVGTDVPTTGGALGGNAQPKAPANLNFEE